MKWMIVFIAAVFVFGTTGCNILEKIKTKSKNLKLSSGVKSESNATTYVLPFAVKLAGQAAAPKNDICAAIANPVANNAEIVVSAAKNDMMIINVFHSDDNGNVSTASKAAAIILIKKGENKTTLDKTTEKHKLKAGTYMMNVMAERKTARVIFTVK